MEEEDLHFHMVVSVHIELLSPEKKYSRELCKTIYWKIQYIV